MSYEIRIGLLAAICIAVTVWGYKFMKGKNLLNASNYYYAEYENIDELSATSPVLIRGLRVGTVAEVRLSDDMQSIIAKLDINRGIKIPKGTEAIIMNTSIMGGKAVVLDVKEPCTGDGCAKRGDKLPGKVEGLIESLFGGQDIEGYVQKVKAGIGDIVTDVSDSIGASDAGNEFAKTFQALQMVLYNLEGITKQINGSMNVYDRKMQSLLTNVESLSANLADNNAHISSAIANLDALSGDLKDAEIGKSAQNAMQSLDETLAKADRSFTELESLLSRINSNDGTLGKLIKDKELYDNFNESSRQLSILLQDFRLNPKRYVNVSVFGKKQREYELPEDDPAENE